MMNYSISVITFIILILAYNKFISTTKLLHYNAFNPLILHICSYFDTDMYFHVRKFITSICRKKADIFFNSIINTSFGYTLNKT